MSYGMHRRSIILLEAGYSLDMYNIALKKGKYAFIVKYFK